MNVPAAGLGFLAVVFCGVFRAKVPIWSPNAKREPVEIRGAGKAFQELFPEINDDEPPSPTDP